MSGLTEPERWRQLWDGLNAYSGALKDLSELRPKIEVFLEHSNKYMANYADSTIKAINEILAGKIDNMEHILANIRWH